MENAETVEKIFNNVTHSKKIHEAVLFVENSKGDFSVNCGYGGKDIYSPIFMASVTKLFVTTCILILQEQKKLSLDNNIDNYIDKTILEGLHIYKGKEYSYKITLSDLLFNKSGLADGLEEGGFLKSVVQNDIEVSFEAVLAKTKELGPHFKPNKAKKAYYSDLNFRLLCIVIEKVTGLPLAEVYQNYICIPLGLGNTYLPTRENVFIPNVYYKNKSLHPKNFFISSYNYDAISTAKDLMKFLKAFWCGVLFPNSAFEKLSEYRKLQISMGPIYYGGGYMQIPLNSIYTFFMGKSELIGHSGTTGSFAFYYPFKDLFFVGGVNQMADPGIPIRLVMRLAMSVK
jgi:CubicO group peptidase (beta-lactamase class C family)